MADDKIPYPSYEGQEENKTLLEKIREKIRMYSLTLLEKHPLIIMFGAIFMVIGIVIYGMVITAIKFIDFFGRSFWGIVLGIICAIVYVILELWNN